MSRPPPPPPRRPLPAAYRFPDYGYGDEERKEPITQRCYMGNKIRVTVSSAQDGYQNSGTNYPPVRRLPRVEERRVRSRSREYFAHPRRRGSSARSSSSNARAQREADRMDSSNARARREASRVDYVEIRPQYPSSRRSRASSSASIISNSDEVSTLEFEFDLSESTASSNSHSTSTIQDVQPDSKQNAGYGLTAGPTTNLHLAATRWLGNTFDDWDLGVELTTVPASPHLRSQMDWHHMERSMPTFDEFIAVARRSLQKMPQKNLRRVEKMLRKVQKENEKQRQFGREMIPICVSDTEYQDDGMEDKQNFSACFSAFPFFSLERLAEEKSSTSTTASHQPRPLLQTYTRTVNSKRELSQAVTTRSSTPKDHSLHVSSVWCLVVDDTIITCSRMGLEELRKDFSSMSSQPQKTSARSVRVKVGNDRSWSFPLDEVRSWPSLLSIFADDLSSIGNCDASAKITHQERTVDAATWHHVVANATQFPIQLVLKESLNTGSGLRSKLRSVKQAFGPQSQIKRSGSPNAVDVAAADHGGAGSAASPRDIVNHLQGIQALHIFGLDSKAASSPLSRLAESLHDKLAAHSNEMAASAYNSCPEASLEDIQTSLSQDKTPSRIDTSRTDTSMATGKCGQIVILAEYVFAFFWPVDFDHVMTRRFWGALKGLLNSSIGESKMSRHNAELAAEFYHILYSRVFAVVSTLTTNFASDVPPTPLPTQFYESWLHLLSAFVLFNQAIQKDARPRPRLLPTLQLRCAATKLETGERELVNKLRTIDVEDHEICPPRGVVALMLNRFSQDMIKEGLDVAQIYGDFYQQLDAKILDNPLTRAHQASIRDLQQELEAVLNILTYQLDVVNVFERSIQAQDDGGRQRMPYLPLLLLDSRQDAILGTCKNSLTARIDKIKALQGRATELGEWHLGEIDSNKDRQEAAIMVFTIVTIIFLPLSFVSSVFGMNSSDIRDMEFGQWLYWVVALPLTIVVIGGSLYWAGALENWQGWSPKWGRSNGNYYQPPVVSQQSTRVVPGVRRDVVEEIDGERPRRRTTYPARRTARHYV